MSRVPTYMELDKTDEAIAIGSCPCDWPHDVRATLGLSLPVTLRPLFVIATLIFSCGDSCDNSQNQCERRAVLNHNR